MALKSTPQNNLNVNTYTNTAQTIKGDIDIIFYGGTLKQSS